MLDTVASGDWAPVSGDMLLLSTIDNAFLHMHFLAIKWVMLFSGSCSFPR